MRILYKKPFVTPESIASVQNALSATNWFDNTAKQRTGDHVLDVCADCTDGGERLAVAEPLQSAHSSESAPIQDSGEQRTMVAWICVPPLTTCDSERTVN